MKLVRNVNFKYSCQAQVAVLAGRWSSGRSKWRRIRSRKKVEEEVGEVGGGGGGEKGGGHRWRRGRGGG